MLDIVMLIWHTTVNVENCIDRPATSVGRPLFHRISDMSHRPRAGAAGVQPPRRQRRKPRQWTKLRRQRFLETLAESCNVSKAALAAGVDRSSAYDLKARDPEFMRGWRKALERAYGELEWDLLKDAKEGDVRTEVTFDPKTGEPTRVKVTQRRAHAVALCLYRTHHNEVTAFRAAEAADQDRPDVAARVQARMEEIRSLLVKNAAKKISGGSDDGEGTEQS
ncbi:MAG: hypothetical protein J7485_05550 [Sphingobium sp.]|nr:hypothetical protein [Sphingobium sp.]